MPQLIHRHSEGIFIIAATPFCDNGSLDLASTDSMIEFYLESGVSGITILGIMGEAPKLGDVESKDFAKLATYMAVRYPDMYTGGMDDLTVAWLPVGTAFRIHEYDGSESIEVREELNWIIT